MVVAVRAVLVPVCSFSRCATMPSFVATYASSNSRASFLKAFLHFLHIKVMSKDCMSGWSLCSTWHSAQSNHFLPGDSQHAAWTAVLGRRTARRADGDLGVEDVFAAGRQPAAEVMAGCSEGHAGLPHGAGDGRGRGRGRGEVCWGSLCTLRLTAAACEAVVWAACAVIRRCLIAASWRWTCRVSGENLRRHAQAKRAEGREGHVRHRQTLDALDDALLPSLIARPDPPCRRCICWPLLKRHPSRSPANSGGPCSTVEHS